MNTLAKRIPVLLCLLAGLAPAAEAQVFTPTYLAPRSSSDLGVYASDGPGDFAVEGIWRRDLGGYDLGFRLGLVDLGDAALTVGAELRNPLPVGAAPLDLSLTGGLQAVVGDAEGFGGQVGLSVGHTFVTPGLRITPYVHPRLGFLEPLRPEELEGDAELDLLLDAGLDLTFSPDLILRLGIGLEERGADWGIGIAWR